MLKQKRLLVLVARVQGKDVPIAVYPSASQNGLVAAHLDAAKKRGLAIDGHRLLALPVLLHGDVLYVPPGTHYHAPTRVQPVTAPLLLL